MVIENVNPGKYGSRITHDIERTHCFCSDESIVVGEWMRALTKATVGYKYVFFSFLIVYALNFSRARHIAM